MGVSGTMMQRTTFSVYNSTVSQNTAGAWRGLRGWLLAGWEGGGCLYFQHRVLVLCHVCTAATMCLMLGARCVDSGDCAAMWLYQTGYGIESTSVTLDGTSLFDNSGEGLLLLGVPPAPPSLPCCFVPRKHCRSRVRALDVTLSLCRPPNQTHARAYTNTHTLAQVVAFV